ncbi:MAG TPA: hypothetical protein VLI45_09150 [Acidobacteriaceae bacterium]|nr:hypothetical protein [Acidobacteriaceae bacterium]
MDSLGRIAHDAFFAASSVHRARRFDELRASSRRLWESAGIAAAQAGAVSDERAGQAMYLAWLEDTGLPLAHFPTWTDMGHAAQRQWIAAALAARSESRKAQERTA